MEMAGSAAVGVTNVEGFGGCQSGARTGASACIPFVTQTSGMVAFTERMRQLVASFVFLVIGWNCVAPVASGAARTATPACCRRSGAHQCMSGTARTAGEELPSFRATSSDCPYRSPGATPTGVARPQSPALSTGHSPSTSLVSTANGVLVESRLTAGNSQRGPPASYL